MPSLIRFLTVTGVLAGIVLGGLYVLATHYEPELQKCENLSRAFQSVVIRPD